jgi:hypothetical protein
MSSRETPEFGGQLFISTELKFWHFLNAVSYLTLAVSRKLTRIHKFQSKFQIIW